MDIKELEKQLEERRAANAAKEKAKLEAAKADGLKWAIGFEDAKAAALEKHMPEQLVEFSVACIGECLFRWPTEVEHDHFMSKSGALKADLSGVTIDVFENLVARCALYPSGPEFLKLSRERNPSARSAIGGRIIAEMRKSIDEKGK